MDAPRATEFEQQGVPTLFGDAANSEVLSHAGLERARALVVTVPDEAAAEMIVAGARQIAPNLPIIARAASQSGLAHLTELGAGDVVYPELEGGLEVLRTTLLALGYPMLDVQQYTDAVRHDQYNTAISTPEERRVLDQLLRTVRGMEIAWISLTDTSAIVNRTLAEASIRERTDASIIAILRDGQVIANPKSATVFRRGDIVGLIGDAQQVAQAKQLLAQDLNQASGVLEQQINQPVELSPGGAQPQTAD
jgi:CPA2 family monovalent cation:H+ antiporter-2